MQDKIISGQILSAIVKSSKGDSVMQSFLTDLLYEEADHVGQWWWKDIYKKKLTQFMGSKGVKNATKQDRTKKL